MSGTVAYSHFCIVYPPFAQSITHLRRHNLLYVATWITDRASGSVLATNARWARTMKERRKGLIGSPPLQPGEALIIVAGFQVHTLQMDFPIDVVFCTKQWVVKHIVPSMAPARLTRIVIGARYAIELPAGSVPANLARGAQLIVS
jgi:uncharacterized protein